MFVKGEKYYADYRDADGVRHRKAFTSGPLALEFERVQKQLVVKARLKRLKNHVGLAPWRRCLVPKSSPTPSAKATTGKSRRASSSKSVATKRQLKSRGRM